MKERNVMGKAAICSFAAAVVMAGLEFGMTARAEMITDMEGDLSVVQEETVLEAVPESEAPDIQVDVPAAEIISEEEPGTAEPEIVELEIVEIEESLIPGAACPDPGLSGEETEAANEEQQTEMTEAAEAPETYISGALTYEDEEVAVTVVASEAAKLPAGTQVKVAKLSEGSEKYEAAKEAASRSLETGEDASYTFYDVTLESEGQVLGVAEGTVSVRLEFKTVDGTEDVVSIEETESGKVARNVTDTAALNERLSSVAVDYSCGR